MRRADDSWRGVTVSWGTLLPEDLLDRFSTVMEEIDPEAFREWVDSWEEGWPKKGDEVGYAIDELVWMLEERAPDGCYFGAAEGDGTLFGFWPFGR